MNPTVGATLADRYRLRARVGVGGSGEVWRALDEMLDREVAVKLVGTDVEPGRLRREARAAARVSHPNVVAVYDAGDVDGRAFLVMELVTGTDLATLVRHGGPLTAGEVAGVARDLAAGLAAVHGAGLVHRDVTPGNLLVTTAGQVKLADLGTARVVDGDGVDQLTRTGLVVGTVDYLAPEQLGDVEPTAATDVYAAGLVLRTCATAVRPFGGGTVSERAARRLTADPAPLPDVERWLATVVAAACRRDPGDRPADGAALLRLLDDLVPHDVGAARPGLAARSAAAVAGDPPPRDDDTDVDAATRDRTTRLDLSTATTTAIPSLRHDAGTEDEQPGPAGHDDDTVADDAHTVPAEDGRDEDRAAAADEPVADVAAAPGADGSSGRGRGRVGLAVLGIVATALVVGVVASSGDDGGDDGGGSAGGGDDGTPTTYEVAAATDFDPLGGDGEHPAEVPNALDGDPTTAWTTQQYTSAALGGLKEGVGLVLDLGEQREVGQVVVDLGVDGVDLEVHVADEPPSGAPPSSTLLASADDAAGTVSLTGDPVPGRWVTVWFTRLGEASGFQAAVREVSVRP